MQMIIFQFTLAPDAYQVEDSLYQTKLYLTAIALPWT